MALESVAVETRDSPGSSAPDNEAAKRINSSSEENMPFMDSEGKFGKRYKARAPTACGALWYLWPCIWVSV